MVDYPFVIGNKVVKVKATGIKNAINRVTSKHQNKFINITHAKNMDLISAKVEAAKKSRAEKRKIYIIVDDDGECELNHAPLKGVYAVYSNGSEIALENDADVTATAPRANKNTKTKPLSSVEPAKKKLPAQSEKARTLIANKKASDSADNESNNKNKTMATPKKSAKKAAKKVAAPKKEKGPKEIHFGENPDFGFEKEEWKRIGKFAQKEQLAIRPLLRKHLLKAAAAAGF